MGIDVNSEPRITFSLESLPELLGKGDLRILRTALQNAVGDTYDRQLPTETDGEYLARLIRSAAGIRFERQRSEEAPIDPVFEKLF